MDQPIIGEESVSAIPGLHRRRFLSVLGLSAVAAAAVTLPGCKKNNESTGVDLGSGDIGVLNYAYALEQLEAAFYTQVVASLYSGISAAMG